MVTQISGPWTFEAKMAAVMRETRVSFERYLKIYREKRQWSADHMPERAAMTFGVNRLGPHVPLLLKGFLEVECHEPDYLKEGIRATGSNSVTAEIYTNWAEQEREHWKALRHCLIDSGIFSAHLVDKVILPETMKERWTFEAQTGLVLSIWSAMEAAVYAMLQEDETRRNYGQLRLLVWNEMGAERDERGRRIFRGIPATLIRLMIDEGRHRDQFEEIVLIWMKYFPDQVMEAIRTIYRGYKMPVIRLSDKEAFANAVVDHNIDSGQTVKKILRHGRARLGLGSERLKIGSTGAVITALREAKKLPADAIIQLPRSKVLDISGAPIYEIQPTGDFLLVKSA